MKGLPGAIDDRPRDGAGTGEHQLDVVHACVAADVQHLSGSRILLCVRIGHEKTSPAGLDPVVAVPEAPGLELAIRIGDDHSRQVASGDVDERIADRLPERRHDPANDGSRLLLIDLEEVTAGRGWRGDQQRIGGRLEIQIAGLLTCPNVNQARRALETWCHPRKDQTTTRDDPLHDFSIGNDTRRQRHDHQRAAGRHDVRPGW